MEKRAQTSTELIIILSVFLLILIILIGVNYDTLRAYDARLRIDRTNTFVNDVVNAAESVYQQGIGAKSKIYVDIPDRVSEVSISGTKFKITFDDNNIIQKKLEFNVTGNVSALSGRRLVTIESTSNFVNISDV